MTKGKKKIARKMSEAKDAEVATVVVLLARMSDASTSAEPSLQQIHEQLTQLSRALQLVTESREEQGVQ
jgi:hypothetical protein